MNKQVYFSVLVHAWRLLTEGCQYSGVINQLEPSTIKVSNCDYCVLGTDDWTNTYNLEPEQLLRLDFSKSTHADFQPEGPTILKHSLNHV